MDAITETERQRQPDGQSPLMMTVQELARELQLSVKTVRRHEKEGKIPEPARLGQQIRWPRQMILDWIAADCPSRDEWKWKGRRPPGKL